MDDAGAILFAPDVGFVGQSSFDYTISDPNGAVSSATVTIDVALHNIQILCLLLQLLMALPSYSPPTA